MVRADTVPVMCNVQEELLIRRRNAGIVSSLSASCNNMQMLHNKGRAASIEKTKVTRQENPLQILTKQSHVLKTRHNVITLPSSMNCSRTGSAVEMVADQQYKGTSFKPKCFKSFQMWFEE